MAVQPNEPIFCDNIGRTAHDLHCCYLANQNTSECQEILTHIAGPLNPKFSDWITDCANKNKIYRSLTQTDATGDGQALYRRFSTCASVPTMRSYLSHNALQPSVSSVVGPHLSLENTTDEHLSNVTDAVTYCLTQTCRQARLAEKCRYECAPVNLLLNSTTPNVQGINTCINTLCSNNDSSLPYADPDIIGIGVS